ncbi:NYN domain-containing protein [Streptomyces alkaliterrae]|uniref:NYN domain-containing protein n=1 Tax=Streptomyces alkaliterrae TaxID=2213162 RepID=A0A5P0YWE5_9ACTN|nr:NYN domain-containing protein [Streptomyces alkaliterrae]MBB1256138.1 NYN domain-containing protein [Streptomyces alkaliterrae]MBB1261522.1 NYN domain-containing protein [Streptomyces alkaliterrae]MQS04603.1 NYN domain-containing protein [Streptomyces alkaliterrae]
MGRTAVLVDGFNLYHGMKKQRGRRYLWLDHVELASRLRRRDEIVDVRYFTAPVLDDADAADRQRTYLEALEAHNPGVLTVVKGRYQRKRMRCRTCGADWISYEEKETDVNIAVALMEIAAAAEVDAVLVVSADSDLCPAVRSARRVNPQLTIVPAFPPHRRSGELSALLPSAFTISETKLRQSQLPSVVRDSVTGAKYVRPTYWQ